MNTLTKAWTLTTDWVIASEYIVHLALMGWVNQTRIQLRSQLYKLGFISL